MCTCKLLMTATHGNGTAAIETRKLNVVNATRPPRLNTPSSLSLVDEKAVHALAAHGPAKLLGIKKDLLDVIHRLERRQQADRMLGHILKHTQAHGVALHALHVDLVNAELGLVRCSLSLPQPATT